MMNVCPYYLLSAVFRSTYPGCYNHFDIVVINILTMCITDIVMISHVSAYCFFFLDGIQFCQRTWLKQKS